MGFYFSNLPEELNNGLDIIRDFLPFKVSSRGVCVNVVSCEKGFSIEKNENGITLSYAKKSDFFRALSFLNEVNRTDNAIAQKLQFRTLCYMADMSRNAVMHCNGLKKLLSLLALMGYNAFMLYTEETYEIPEYPYFGHMRGRYSQDELRKIDDMAFALGIEVIPCIQTLAHLTSALRWKCFQPYTDTGDILLCEDERTYQLIDCMLKSVSILRSRRVHIGMDEAHSLGLGTYLDIHGYQNRFDILSKHLSRVKNLCDSYGFEPMIWSDMYFRLFNHGGYYMKDQMLPDEILNKIPDGVGLVYWDYYNRNTEVLDCMFENHKAFNRPVIFAGGAWKWTGFAPCNRLSMSATEIQLDACLKYGCDDVIATGWGDNGAEASQFSILPCLSLYAERGYDLNSTAESRSVRFEDTFGISLDDFMAIDLPNEIYAEPAASFPNPCKFMLYNVVLGGLFDGHIPNDSSRKYLEIAHRLTEVANHPSFGYMFASLASLCYVLEKKCDVSSGIRKAYLEKKTDVLRWYADKEIPEILSRIDDFFVLFRQQWYSENKTFGFEAQEVRIGGVKQLLQSAADRIKSYCNGEVDAIEELEQPVLPISVQADGSPAKMFRSNEWIHAFAPKM